jgi:putative transposase
MKKRQTADEVARLLRDVDRDLATGLTISDARCKIGVAATTYYRWRQRHDPPTVDADRRCRELEAEVDRLKRLVAERPVACPSSCPRAGRRSLVTMIPMYSLGPRRRLSGRDSGRPY